MRQTTNMTPTIAASDEVDDFIQQDSCTVDIKINKLLQILAQVDLYAMKFGTWIEMRTPFTSKIRITFEYHDLGFEPA